MSDLSLSMTPAGAMKIIREIERTPGRNDKADLLAQLMSDPLGQWIIEVTYNPFKTWGIKPGKLDIKSGVFDCGFDAENMRKLLNNLSKRTITGNDAKIVVKAMNDSLDLDGRDLLYRILSKDLKAGIGLSTIHLIKPGLIPAFAVMRAEAYEKKHVKSWPWKYEYKLDGQRNTFLCKNGEGSFFTRSGKSVPALDHLVQPMLQVAKNAAADPDLGKVIVDKNGEISFMADGEAMMGLFEETGALRRKGVEAKGAELHLYDIMSFADFDAAGPVGLPLKERRELLSKFFRLSKEVLNGTEYAQTIQMVPQFFANSDEDMQQGFAEARSTTLASYLARGDALKEQKLLKTTIDKATGNAKVLEGVMGKDPEALYHKKKCRSWLKMKAEETEDLRVIGAYSGKPGTKYEDCAGGLIVDRNGVEVRCSGMDDPDRIAMWELWEKDLERADTKHVQTANRGLGHVITENPFSNKILVGRLIEIEFHEVTPDGSLRHPRFVRFRDDKDGEIADKEKAA